MFGDTLKPIETNSFESTVDSFFYKFIDIHGDSVVDA